MVQKRNKAGKIVPLFPVHGAGKLENKQKARIFSGLIDN